mmetsp:Transcript_149411/g.271983  ORF Transcript_149411/g.271983 Transcript_149411/m.271983 type:complete len:203 (+) Transcript_149411:2679-3287(+)
MHHLLESTLQNGKPFLHCTFGLKNHFEVICKLRLSFERVVDTGGRHARMNQMKFLDSAGADARARQHFHRYLCGACRSHQCRTMQAKPFDSSCRFSRQSLAKLLCSTFIIEKFSDVRHARTCRSQVQNDDSSILCPEQLFHLGQKVLAELCGPLALAWIYFGTMQTNNNLSVVLSDKMLRLRRTIAFAKYKISRSIPALFLI